MQALIIQLSALSGLLMFLQMAWTQAPLAHALLQGAGTGLTVYLVAVVGLTLVRHILTYTPVPPEETPKQKVEIEGVSPANPNRPAKPGAASSERAGATAGGDAAHTAQRSPARETALAS